MALNFSLDSLMEQSLLSDLPSYSASSLAP